MRCSIRCDRIFLSSTVDTTWSILMCFAPYHVRLPKICFTCLTWWTLAFQHLKELNLRRVGHLHQHSLTTTTEPQLFSAGTSWASWNDKHVDARWKKLMQIICKCNMFKKLHQTWQLWRGVLWSLPLNGLRVEVHRLGSWDLGTRSLKRRTIEFTHQQSSKSTGTARCKRACLSRGTSNRSALVGGLHFFWR